MKDQYNETFCKNIFVNVTFNALRQKMNPSSKFLYHFNFCESAHLS